MEREPGGEAGERRREATQSEAWRSLPLASLLTDRNGCLEDANGAFARLTGFSCPELTGKDWRMIIRAEADPEEFARMRDALRAGGSFQGKLLHLRSSGEPFWGFVAVTPIRSPDGEVLHFVSTHLDITGELELRRQSHDRAATSHMLLGLAQQLGSAADRSAIADAAAATLLELGAEHSTVALVDPAGTLRVAGHAGWGQLAAKVSEFRVTASESPELATLMAERAPILIGPHSSPWARGLLEDFGSTGFIAVPVISTRVLRGVLIAAWSSRPPPDGLAENLVARLQGIAGLTATALDNHDLIDRIRRDAEEDALTGLANRGVSEQRLVEALGHLDAGEGVAVLYCDVDRFKRLNDGLGHAGGDEALRQIAGRLRSIAGPDDTVGRPGGDEFLLVLPHLAGPDAVERAVHAVQDALEAPLQIHGREVAVTVSIGTATRWHGDVGRDPAPAAEEADLLIRSADAAMYRMKERRRHDDAARPGWSQGS